MVTNHQVGNDKIAQKTAIDKHLCVDSFVFINSCFLGHLVIARLMIGYYHETACCGILMCIDCFIWRLMYNRKTEKNCCLPEHLLFSFCKAHAIKAYIFIFLFLFLHILSNLFLSNV